MQCVARTVLDARAADCLLAHAGNHLADVDGGPLGAAQRHDERAVVPGQLLEADVARNLTHAAEHAEDAAFERLLSSAAGQKLQRSLLVQRNQSLAFRVALVHLRLVVSQTSTCERAGSVSHLALLLADEA